MTETEWLTARDPFALLRGVPAGQADRKRILFVCGAWRQQRQSLRETRSQQALAALERLAEDAGPHDPNGILWLALQVEEPLWPQIWQENGDFHPSWTGEGAALAATVLACTLALGLGDSYFATEAEAARAADRIQQEDPAVVAAWTGQLERLADLVRDQFGPLPFRTVAVDPAVLGGTAVDLARTIYEERTFERLPLLADTLEKAGCTQPDLLQHCRSLGEHTRGCWAVDLLLGKQ